jgi:26S proteasome regulatory subunit N2
MHHSAVTFANGFMHSGTSYDTFLRENMEWLSRATNWAKFSATSALGSLHQGQLYNARSLLETYLPSEGVMGSSYSEGGALYALGLVVAGYGNVIAGKDETGIDYLKRMLLASTVDVVQSGGCLGLGLAGMGSRRDGKCAFVLVTGSLP